MSSITNNTLQPFRHSARAERARKKTVIYIFIIYWLLIFEGALRKWAFPQFHEIIFFIRDPIVLLVYILAFRHNLIRKTALLQAAVIISVVFLFLIFIQLMVIEINPLTLLYGWRMYFFYLPLAFVIKDTFYLDDIYKLIRHTLYVCIPLSILIFIQYISPPYSFINAGYSTSGVFIVANNIVRTTGTFTFTAGQTMFSASLISMMIIAWIYRKNKKLLSFPFLIIATGASITTLLLSGSRTAFFMAGLIVIATFIGLLFTKNVKLKFTGNMMLIFLILVSIALFIGPFRESLDALGTRFEQAEASEGSAIRRAFLPLIIFTQHITETPILGHGLGLGTSGGSKLATGEVKLVLAEDEWSRVIMESGPFFGLVYILYRVIFSFIVFSQSIRSARFDNNLLPIIFLGFIGFYTLAGQITHQGTIQGYNWIFLGIVMASAKRLTSRKYNTKSS